jgi:isopentenyl diphosphate isomerase/L-lactate dehydrogenase-like FMN-dependent dehydrogenase
MFGVMVAAVAFAMPASADDGVYPPPAGTEVLGTSASAPVAVAGVSAGTNEGLAFTGGTMAGIGALGGLLLVGGTTLVVAARRRKVDA